MNKKKKKQELATVLIQAMRESDILFSSYGKNKEVKTLEDFVRKLDPDWGNRPSKPRSHENQRTQ